MDKEKESRFIAANDKIRKLPIDGAFERGSARWKLYGLSKQITDGDCKVECPPAENAVLTSKWQAWQSYRGRSRDAAMTDFLIEFDKYEAAEKKAAAAREASAAAAVHRSSILQSSIPTKRGSVIQNPGIIKEGTLYKQRDVFKGWRPRRFILQDCFLHYYLEPDDVVPRRSMDISGCKVAAEKPGRIGDNDQELFPFVISHAKDSRMYTLAADSKAEAEDWIVKISSAANQSDGSRSSVLEGSPSASSNSGSGGGGNRLLDDTRVDGGDNTPTDEKNRFKSVNPEISLANLPSRFAQKVEVAVRTLAQAVEPTAPNWEPLYEKNGVIARKRSGDVMCVRGDGSVPFPLPEVLGIISNADRLVEIDAQLQSARLLKAFSQNTGVFHLKYKQVWPTNPRDVVCLYHWRLLPDNRVVFLSFSERFDNELCPPEDGTVRAELILGGYVLTPTTFNETLIQYVIQIDMKGNLASGIVNLVSNSQPLNVFSIKKVLTENLAGTTSIYAGRKLTFEDLLEVSDLNGDAAPNTKRESSPAPATIISTNNNNPAPTATTVASAKSSAKSAAVPADAAPAKESYKPGSILKSVVSSAKSAISGTSGTGSGSGSGSGSSSQRKGKVKPSQISLIALLVLLTPTLIHYVVGNQYRALAFCLTLIFAIRYILLLHLGSPVRKPTARGIGPPPQGRTLIRIPLDLGKILMYIQGKEEETGLTVTMSQLAAKAAAQTLTDFPQLNGRILFGKFYRSREPGIDISLSVELPDIGPVMLKIVDCDRKPTEYIANEVQLASKSLNESKKGGVLSKKDAILQKLSPFLASELESWFNFLGAQLGLSIPALDINGFPLGVCSIVTAPKTHDADIDVALIPNHSDTSTPITVTIGGIRTMPSLEKDGKVVGKPVMNVAVSIDTTACSLTEAHRFTSTFQHYMNNPMYLHLDKYEQRKLREQQEGSRRQSVKH